ncbi:hypothetical protein GCM10027445_45750 [Amycolatopsis endophytica]|uniref:Uncharacterized protein n=1 Tax=Amycolatopsis endophytica TaxID=860233 RepID=A0A853B0E8_9PSEU|nr:hypothetical protein [Amycolatopsis endophytica]NYI88533.1 hypothetical protein [Amycolatopsis endophytica]
MWGALDAEPSSLDRATGHLGEILTKLDTRALDDVVPSVDVYGDAALTSKVRDFADLARIAATALRERVGLTGSALQDTAMLFRGMELDNEAAIRRAGR